MGNISYRFLVSRAVLLDIRLAIGFPVFLGAVRSVIAMDTHQIATNEREYVGWVICSV